MTEKTVKRIRFYYGLALSVLTVLLALSFGLQTLAIYNGGGDSPYTYEGVKSALTKLFPFVLAWIIFVAFGGVFGLVYPEKEHLKAQKDAKITLKKLYSRFPEYKTQSEKFEKRRKTVYFIGLSILIIGALAVIAYLFNGNNFPAVEGGAFVTEEVLKALALVFPIAIFVGGVFVFVSFYSDWTYGKELEEVKVAIAKAPKREKQVEKKESAEQSTKLLTGIRIGVAVVGLTLVIVGIYNGGMQDVFAKAIKICTECIGLG